MKDDIYLRNPVPRPGSFRFDAGVAAAFDDMAERSIPLYRELQEACARIAASIVNDGDLVYDLGCSTGATTLAIAYALSGKTVRIVAVDSSVEMLDICRSKLAGAGVSAELLGASASDLSLDVPATLVTCNYLLQFLPVECRAPLLRRIWSALRPGGALILSEKCSADSPDGRATMDRLYDAFKARNGYTSTEIEAKKRALENVLVPLSEAENSAMLRAAGFETSFVILKAYHFTTWLCLK